MVQDVLMINYEQKSTLNHSKANLALVAAAFSGLASATTAHRAAAASLPELAAKEMEIAEEGTAWANSQISFKKMQGRVQLTVQNIWDNIYPWGVSTSFP